MSELAYAVEREIDVPVEVLWDAWTDPVALEAWYHPTDLACVPGSVVSDPVVGGWWTVGVDVPEHGYVAWFYGRYTEVVDKVRLEHTMHYTQSAEEFAARDESGEHHRIVIEFEERGFRSWVRFSQYGDMPDAMARGAQEGMESYFDSLEAYLTVA